MITMPASLMLITHKKAPKIIAKRRYGSCNHDYSWLLIVALGFFIFIASIGCATPSFQEETTPLDLDARHMQGVESTQKKIKAEIALFPLENFTDDRKAVEYVMPLLREKLEEKGISVLDEDSLDKFLIKERVRSTGYISKELATKVGEEFNVKAIFVGNINSFYGGNNPGVGFSARLVNASDGSIIWADHASATGEDFVGILGLGHIGTIEKLTNRVLNHLLDSFTIMPRYKAKELTYTVAVMPFQNESRVKKAGIIAMNMFIEELFKSAKFEPLEYGEVRRLVVKFRVRSKGELDFKNTGAIEDYAGVDGILVGTVEYYSEGQSSAPPEAIISARLIDARKNRILWYDGYQYKGDDGISIFDWGRMRSAEKVAYEVVSKLVKEMSRAKWQ